MTTTYTSCHGECDDDCTAGNEEDDDDEYDDYDYDDTDNVCQQPNMNQHHNYTCRSIHQASQLIYKQNASGTLQM